jgi:hypothetical protein
MSLLFVAGVMGIAAFVGFSWVAYHLIFRWPPPAEPEGRVESWRRR